MLLKQITIIVQKENMQSIDLYVNESVLFNKQNKKRISIKLIRENRVRDY